MELISDDLVTQVRVSTGRPALLAAWRERRSCHNLPTPSPDLFSAV